MEKQKEYKSEGAVVAYNTGEVEVKLTAEVIKKYLVRGKPELLTTQEIMFFMGICRARLLNPFAGDCYLIKYSQDPAAIVTSIDFKRARARQAPDCKGWKKGVIVRTSKGELRYSPGLVMEDETLVGGWFEAIPDGWSVPFKLEVNLNGYLKKTSDGKITKFWQPENQPTMIAKVAESQGLSAVWPRELGKLYTPEETGHSDEQITYEIGKNGEPEPPDFAELVAQVKEKFSPESLTAFLEVTAKGNSSTVEQVQDMARRNWDRFWGAFLKWRTAQGKAKSTKGDNNDQPTTEKTPPAGAQAGTRPDSTMVPCPNDEGAMQALGYCRGNCAKFVGCPAVEV